MAKVALIAGVGPGLGRQLALTFHRAGYRVGMLARSEQRLADLAAEMGDDGVAWMSADAADFVQFRDAINRLSDQLGPPTVGIYNTADLSPDNALNIDPSVFSRRLDVNITGALVMAQTVSGRMARADGTEHLLFTGGGFAHRPSPSMSSLSMGKQGVLMLTKLIEEQLAVRRIAVTCMTINSFIGAPGASAEQIAEAYLQRVDSGLSGEFMFNPS